MVKHTPGPWRIVRASDYTDDPEDTQVQSIEGANGATVYYTESGYFKPREADVRLIAAAPEMAESIDALLHLLETPGDMTKEEQQEILGDATALLARINGDNHA